MRYREEFSVMVHDVGHNDLARPSSVWRYMQEAANHQLQAEKPSFRELLEDGKAFILSRMRLVCGQPLRPYDRITVETWDCGGRGASFLRGYRVLRGAETVAEGDSVWALVHTADHTLCRVGDVQLCYSRDDPPDLPLPARLRLPEEGFSPVGEKDVRLSDIDCMGHMNNTNYPDMLWDFVPEGDGRFLRSLMIDYRHDAPLGCRVDISRREEGDAFFFRTHREGLVNVEARMETGLLPPGWGPPPYAGA